MSKLVFTNYRNGGKMSDSQSLVLHECQYEADIILTVSLDIRDPEI